MSQQFYIALNGQQTGPFTIDDLKAKNIQRDTLVWTEGLDNWTKAEHVPLLKEVLRATPPPLPNTEAKTSSQQAPPPPPAPPVYNDKHFGYDLARRRERLFATIIEAIIITVPLLLLFGESINDNGLYSFESIFGYGILSAILGAIFYPMWGGNLGHKIMGLTVISVENGEIQNNAKTGAIREVLKCVFSLVIIPDVWLLWDDNRQNLYDKVAKTYVVKKKAGTIKKFFSGCFLFVLTFFFIVFLFIWGSIYFYIDGVPALSNYVVAQIPTSVDKEVGRELRREILSSAPIDEEKTELLTQFYSNLGYDTKTKVYVVKAREFNAFALPDNSIFVYDQVLKEVKSYPELAALLGHEYIHIKNRHGMKTLAHSISRELITEMLSGGDNSEKFISNSNKLLTLKKSRDFETEADKSGLDLLIQNRIDINGITELFKRMDKIAEREGKSVPAYLSTHPDSEDRLETIEEEIKDKQNNYDHNDKLDDLFQQLTTFTNSYE